ARFPPCRCAASGRLAWRRNEDRSSPGLLEYSQDDARLRFRLDSQKSQVLVYLPVQFPGRPAGLRMQFDLRLEVPAAGSRRIVRDLHRQLREAIVAGRLLPSARLPPSREFARQYGVSRSTATAVYELLLAEGFLAARRGAGTFVAAKLRVP